MLPAFDQDTRFTRAEIVGFTIVLVVATMLPLAGSGGWFSWAGMCLAGVFLLYYVGKLAASSSTVRASRLLHASVLYLPVVLVIMVIAKK
jgi:heme O synthase-like polyprenyltransferase